MINKANSWLRFLIKYLVPQNRNLVNPTLICLDFWRNMGSQIGILKEDRDTRYGQSNVFNLEVKP